MILALIIATSGWQPPSALEWTGLALTETFIAIDLRQTQLGLNRGASETGPAGGSRPKAVHGEIVRVWHRKQFLHGP